MRELTNEERSRDEAVRRERILTLPSLTLVRLGWEIEPGRVQGGIFYRSGDGLGPTGRDSRPADVLRRELQRSHMPHDDQRWGIEILAAPVGLLRRAVGALAWDHTPTPADKRGDKCPSCELLGELVDLLGLDPERLR